MLEKVKAYKGFSVVKTFNEETNSFERHIECRGFRFEEGKTYEEPEAILCERGFHACTFPLDVFKYYGCYKYSADSVEYHIVELEDVSDETSVDSKICGKKITIKEKISPEELVNIAKHHFAIPIKSMNNVNIRPIFLPSCFLIKDNVNDATPITCRTATFDYDRGLSYIDFIAGTQNSDKDLNDLYRRIEPEDLKHYSFWTGVPPQEELDGYNYCRERMMRDGNTNR